MKVFGKWSQVFLAPVKSGTRNGFLLLQVEICMTAVYQQSVVPFVERESALQVIVESLVRLVLANSLYLLIEKVWLQSCKMGVVMSRLWFYMFPAKEYKIVVVGLDNAGKTTTLYKLHLGEVVVTQPTVGSNVEELVYKNIRFEVWDLGGQERLRTSWATYYRGTHAVVMVVDSTDRARISIIKDELFKLLQHEDLQSSAVLVFANKQDLKDAMTPAEISDALSLHSIKNHDWHIQACCALTGEGLWDGLEIDVMLNRHE
jgi:ADP-ribosylation factor-like protein 5B